MKADHSWKAGSLFQVGSVASLVYPAEKMPSAFGNPAGRSTAPIERETLLRKCSGFQPISATFLIAWAANLGVVTSKKMSAPEACRLTIWESGLGSAVS